MKQNKNEYEINKQVHVELQKNISTEKLFIL